MLVALDALAADTPAVGGKAAGLAVARRLGLAVPPGFVLPWTAALDAAALRAATAGRGPWVVRSSASLEDAAGGAAPGIFLSRRDVASDDVPAAVAAVRASLASPTAEAYRAARGLPPGQMAVIVQEQIAGPRGTAYSRAPGDPARVLVEHDERLAAVGDDAVTGDVGLPRAALLAIAAAARALDAALGGAADVEWVWGDRLWIVQARRVAAPVVASSTVSPEELAAALAFSRAEPEALWRWDAEHNPAPLSPAQAGLVELVERAEAAAVRQRVILGYLYTTRHGARPPDRVVDAAALPRVYAEEIVPDFERDLAAMGDDLEATLAAYVRFYRRYARILAPSVAGAGGVTLPAPAEQPLAGLAPAWDVAAPAYGDGHARLARLADADDLFFARAQAGVRRALVATADRLGIAPDDVMFLPLDELCAGVTRDAAGRAAAARAELRRLAAFAPPFVVANGVAVFGPPGDATLLRGHGTGGRARGEVLRLDADLPRSTRGRVLVVATVTPLMAPLLDGAAAIVAEHGGLLGHGAALARELAIPCVVGCVGALTALTDGDDVWVDADAGVVLRLRS